MTIEIVHPYANRTSNLYKETILTDQSGTCDNCHEEVIADVYAFRRNDTYLPENQLGADILGDFIHINETCRDPRAEIVW